MVLLQHLYVRIIGKAIFADRGEIGRLPSRTIKILLDLGGRHGEMYCYPAQMARDDQEQGVYD
jgi:hypothetical protein